MISSGQRFSKSSSFTLNSVTTRNKDDTRCRRVRYVDNADTAFSRTLMLLFDVGDTVEALYQQDIPHIFLHVHLKQSVTALYRNRSIVQKRITLARCTLIAATLQDSRNQIDSPCYSSALTYTTLPAGSAGTSTYIKL